MSRVVFQLLGLFILVSFFKASGQNMTKDTLKIEEVNIVKSRINHFSIVDKKRVIDSLTLDRYSSQNLGNLLQKTSLINVSSNGGVGNLATASIRGASSTHTTLNWNGIPVNSLTTGSADLSLINVGGFDQIDVVYAASGALYGNGTMGGVINLSSKPSWNKKTSIRAVIETGGYANYSNKFYSNGNSKIFNNLSSHKGQLHVKSSGSTVSYSGQVFYQDSENDFKYIDILDFGTPEEKLDHNNNKMFGTIQDVHFKMDKHYWDVGFWYMVKDKKIPGKMAVGPPYSNQEQKDSLIRGYVGWKTLMGKVRLEAKVAYLFDFLRFTDTSLFSEIYSKRWLNNINSRYYLDEYLSADIDFKYGILNGKTSSYQKEEQDFRFSLATKYTKNKISLIYSISKEWNTVKDIPLMISYSAMYDIGDLLIAKFKTGTHYRRPTFNERYWKPGGNEVLNSEEGESYEIGLTLLEQLMFYGKFEADVSIYLSDSKEAISWQPIQGETFWGPINIGKMISRGVELDFFHKYEMTSGDLENLISYGYNNTYNNNKNSEDFKKTLAYRPEHIIKYSTNYSSNKWNTGVLFSYQSSSKTNDRNNQIEAFCIVDYNFGLKWKVGTVRLNTNLRIENVLNRSYQVIYAYPMPGRSFYITAIIKY